MPQKFQIIKTKRLKKSSHKWLLRQINDPFVERARAEGWKSRAAFKIIEIDEKFKIFKKGKVVLDLGAAPGGWSQYAVTKVGDGNVVALDLLPISNISGVKFFEQDFLAEDAPEKIINELKNIRRNVEGKCDVLMSDMASNTTGDHATDHLRIIALLESSLELAGKILRNGGCFAGKVFQGGEVDEIIKKLRKDFLSVKYFKPDSSRKESSEIYLVATGFRFKEKEAEEKLAESLRNKKRTS